MLEAAISGAQHLFSPGPIIGMLLVLPLSFNLGVDPGRRTADYGCGSFTCRCPGRMDCHHNRSVQHGSERHHRARALDLAGDSRLTLSASDGLGRLSHGPPRFSRCSVGRELHDDFGRRSFWGGGPAFGATGLSRAPAAIWIGGIFPAIAFGCDGRRRSQVGAIVKGMLTAAFGLAISMIGYSPIGGEIRTDFGMDTCGTAYPLFPSSLGYSLYRRQSTWLWQTSQSQQSGLKRS